MPTREVLYPASSNYDVSLRGMIGDVVRSHYLADTSNLLASRPSSGNQAVGWAPQLRHRNKLTAGPIQAWKEKMLAKILRGTTSHVTIANCIIFSQSQSRVIKLYFTKHIH